MTSKKFLCLLIIPNSQAPEPALITFAVYYARTGVPMLPLKIVARPWTYDNQPLKK